MATAVYLLCALTSAACALLLFREYRRNPTRLLFWSSVSFAGFAVSNALAFTDYVIVPTMDMSAVRPFVALASIGALVSGLVWDTD